MVFLRPTKYGDIFQLQMEVGDNEGDLIIAMEKIGFYKFQVYTKCNVYDIDTDELLEEDINCWSNRYIGISYENFESAIDNSKRNGTRLQFYKNKVIAIDTQAKLYGVYNFGDIPVRWDLAKDEWNG